MERAGARDIEGEATRVGASKPGGERVSNKGGRKRVKAIRVKEFGGPEVLQLEEVQTPEPKSGELLVRIHAAGVNPVETYIRAGTYARLPELPYTPGNDGAGVVEQVGSDVTEFNPGDRVYAAGSISGTYAEF